MKKKIINGLLMMALVVATTSSFVSCKDTVGDDYARLHEELSNETSLRDALQTQLNTLQTQVNNLKQCGCEVPFTKKYANLLNDLQNMIDTGGGIALPGSGAQGGVGNLAEWILAVNKMLNELETELNTIKNDYATATALNDLKTTTQQALNGLDGRVTDLETFKQTVEGWDLDNRIKTLEAAKVNLDERLTKAEKTITADSIRINDLTTRLDSIEENFATKQELKDSAVKLRTEIANAEKAAKDYADILAAKINSRIDTIDITIGEMQNTIKALQAADDTIKARLDSLESDVKKLNDRVDAIEANITKIFDAMSKQVTGIIVQGAYSPAFGIGMLPIDAKTNILAAYVGKAAKAVTFPADNASNYVNNSDFWTDEETQFVNFAQYTAAADQVLLSDAKDNAGKLYLTVNPSQVDFEGKLITLENSQGKAAPILLSELKKSDYKLAFGWTRAAVQNGFYEADAKITAENIKDAKARINMDALKTAAINLYQKHNMASLKEAAQTIISQSGDVLDANAAKATYEGLDKDGNIENKTTFSEYSIATTVITPLSYNTLKGWNPTSIPGISTVESVISSFIDKVNIKVNTGFNKKINIPTSIKEIELLELDETLKAKFKMTFVVNIDTTLSKAPTAENPEWEQITASVPVNVKVTPDGDCTIYDENGVPLDYTINLPDYKVDETVTATLNPFRLWVTRTFTVDFTNEIQQLYDGLQKPMGDVNTMLKDLQTFLDDIKPMLDNLTNLDANINGQIENAKNNLKNEIIGYIEKLEKKILSYASYVNQALQPVLLYKTTTGLNRVSTIEKGASKMTGTVMLVPTSFNAELLSPAFKKYMICTGAWDANGNFDAAAAKAANDDTSNENFAKVIDGAERTATFTGKAGYKYRIVYQALDYHGKIASGRYYVQF